MHRRSNTSLFILSRYSIYSGLSLRHFLPRKVPKQDYLGRKTMRRPTLFPPPGTVESLPPSILSEARRLLAELIIAVLEKSAENPPADKEYNHD